ncbi:hypothetical protein A2Z56_00675 [Candidatus Kaiserbacteria bacterium RIFCSPHIGHO2_12_45_16]|nr:MAG: hypothetical protein A2Z56_00675 [Candidatus Kaiserbacteria bacterium RIFCSPHIGHO2_12_45_16]
MGILVLMPKGNTINHNEESRWEMISALALMTITIPAVAIYAILRDLIKGHKPQPRKSHQTKE